MFKFEVRILKSEIRLSNRLPIIIEIESGFGAAKIAIFFLG